MKGAWSPERDALLDELVEGGLTMVEVASRMGVTKNAVIGRLSRREKRGSRAFEHRVEELAARHAKRSPMAQIPPWGRCQWPSGDVGESDFSFCGAPALTGGPYCEMHDGIARGRSGDR